MTRRSSFGWVELLLGILLIILGIYTAANPFTTATVIAVLYGVFAIITGIADIVVYVRLRKRVGYRTTMTLIAGIISIIAGIIILMNLMASTWALAILFPIWFIVHCISRLVNLDYVKEVAGTGMFWFTLILNVIGIILGVMMIFMPGSSLVTLSYLVSFYLILAGISSIALAFSPLGE